ncbi:caspase-like, partial [Ostrinia furnacalis]|uniref:caspase-like n=1 Tax=Ostrinia furnacalis TaxID=93504 RepID=UPI00103CB928
LTVLALNKYSFFLFSVSSRDFTDYGCVAVAVLTHGSRNGLLRAKDTDYSELTIINQLQVHDKPTLVTKPKLVIIQACRGYGSMQGTTVRRAQGQIMKDLDEEEPYTLPVESDMLVLHSSYIGKPSVRDELEGSWFIQSLCKKINELASTHDLESIMTEVRREVAIDRVHEELNRRTDEMDVIKQMPVATSTLIRKLYLKNPVGDSPGPSSTLTTDSDQPPRPFLDNSIPNTPLLVQFGPCSCFLEHFNYIIDCLRHFLNDNPDDVLAQSFLEMADTFEDSANFNSSKEKLAKAVCAYLKSQVNIIPYFKFLYFYKH